MSCYLQTITGKAAAAATALSVTAIVASACEPDADWSTTVFRFALAGVITACTMWVLAHTAVSAQMVEIARQQGWDDGYENGFADGRSENNVLRLERWPSQCPPVAADSPAEEFAQQLHVAGAPDGVV